MRSSAIMPIGSGLDVRRGVPIATDGASQPAEPGEGSLFKLKWMLGMGRGNCLELSFPGSAAVAYPSLVFLETLFLTQSNGQCHLTQKG
jgi:hypothetical protein